MQIVDRSQFGQISAGSGSFSVDGMAYPRSVVFYNLCGNNDGGDIWAEFNLEREYRQLVATVGISDENPTSARGTFRILADGNQVAYGKLVHGQSVPVKIDVANVLRLRLEVNNPSAAASCALKAIPVHTVWGDAVLT